MCGSGRDRERGAGVLRGLGHARDGSGVHGAARVCDLDSGSPRVCVRCVRVRLGEEESGAGPMVSGWRRGGSGAGRVRATLLRTASREVGCGGGSWAAALAGWRAS